MNESNNDLLDSGSKESQETDPEIVFAAIEKERRYYSETHKYMVNMSEPEDAGKAIEMASDELKRDRAFVMSAVKLYGAVLRCLPDEFKEDKEIVMAAVANYPDAIRFAKGNLKQDIDCWIAARLWKNDYWTNKEGSMQNNAKMIVLSTKFSLDEGSRSCLNKFVLQLHQTPYFRDGGFIIYSPNAFGKATCDEEWTRIEWPCRGTYDTCRKDAEFKTGTPNDDSCWRYSYRWHLEQAKRTNGFMLQIVEYDDEISKHRLGKGQAIESELAGAVGTKIFRLLQPLSSDPGGDLHPITFSDYHVAELTKKVKSWNQDDCKDQTSCQYQVFRLYSIFDKWFDRWISPAESRDSREVGVFPGWSQLDDMYKYFSKE